MRRRLCGPSVLLSLAAVIAAALLLTSCSGVTSKGNPGGDPPPTPKTTPTITWPPPAAITNPTPLSATQLNATANVPGSFAYSPPAGTVLAAGTQTLSVTFTPTNVAAYNSAQASVSITVNPAPAPPPPPPPPSLDAYVYVSSGTGNSDSVYALGIFSDGSLAPVNGSPFTAAGAIQATNGKYLFGSDASNIYSYSVASGGTFQQVGSINAQQFNSKDLSGSPCGGPAALFVDHGGGNLYDLDVRSDCANNAYQSFAIDSPTGAMTYVAVTSTATPVFDVPLSFTANDHFAYGASCYHLFQKVFGFTRNSDGSLTSLGNPFPNTPLPAPPAGQSYCPYFAAADSSNHVAVAVQPIDSSTQEAAGPYQLATYSADDSGNLTTTSTSSNMPAASVTSNLGSSLTALSMSPSGDLLAVAGTAGVQVFHFNGADPITAYTQPLISDPIDHIAWDTHGHLYAISHSTGKLYVFTVTATGNSQASGSPYSITSPQNLVVLSQ